jgi:hypothetical protein
MRSLAFVTAVLAYFLAVAWLHPRAVSFDGLAFLMQARAGSIDYGHALYFPLLRAAEGLAGARLEAVDVGALVSAVGAAAAFALLWRHAERAGMTRLRAFLVAAWFGLATLLWQEAGSIEPTSWTLAALLLAAEASERYGRAPSVPRLLGALAAFALALGFHVVSVCALPWLVFRARAGGRAWPRAQLRAHLAVVVAAFLGLIGLAFLGGELGTYFGYWSGFVPTYRGGAVAELGAHVRRGLVVFAEGAPALCLGALVALLARLRARASLRCEELGLAGAYALAFLAFGKPLVGLLVPVVLAAALVLVRFAREARVALLLLGLGLELAFSVPRALAWSHEPDDQRVRAELFAQHVPAGARVFAGTLANHLLFYWPALDVVSLPELWHRAFVHDRRADPIEVVRDAVAAAGRSCVLTGDGAGFLAGGLGADVARLGLRRERAFFLPEDPTLVIFPLDVVPK